MDRADFWAKRARQHAEVLARRIGPRHATSDGEKRAAQYVRDELQRLGLLEARLEPFSGAISAWMPWSIAFSAAAWGMLIGLLFEAIGGAIAAALYLFAAWIAYRELYPSAGPGRASYPIRRWLWHDDSQNAIGVAPSKDPAERRVALMAYLDSARAPFVWRTERRQRLVRRTVPLLFASLLLSAAVFLLGAITSNVLFYFAALALLLPLIAALFFSIRSGRADTCPGANNNAAGVGTLLALAERLKESPLTRTEVWLLATGCRETGGDGIRAILETHGPSLTDATFVALEGVGVGARVVYLTGEGLLRTTHYASETLVVAERAAAHCRENSIPVSAERHPGGPTEMGLIARSGLRGTTVNVWPSHCPGVASRRRSDDSFDAIQSQALAWAHVFAWRLLQEIDL